jgi:hypothetical protein
MARLSITAIRRHKKLSIVEREVTCGNLTRTVYFVGPDKIMDTALASFDVWATDEHLRCKEHSYFAGRFAGGDADYKQRIVGWWAYRALVMFTFDRDVAELMLLELNSK